MPQAPKTFLIVYWGVFCMVVEELVRGKMSTCPKSNKHPSTCLGAMRWPWVGEIMKQGVGCRNPTLKCAEQCSWGQQLRPFLGCYLHFPVRSGPPDTASCPPQEAGCVTHGLTLAPPRRWRRSTSSPRAGSPGLAKGSCSSASSTSTSARISRSPVGLMPTAPATACPSECPSDPGRFCPNPKLPSQPPHAYAPTLVLSMGSGLGLKLSHEIKQEP